jgi:hypothetical protein
MAGEGTFVCEVCGESILPGEPVVMGQESDGATLPGILDAGSDGRIGLFHEDHWQLRIGDWLERDRGHATGPRS